MSLTVHGAGCCLMDLLYPDVAFTNDAFRALTSKTPGDGGINVGGLVFAEDLAGFASRSVTSILEELSGNSPPIAENVGGPAVVSLIHTAQIMPETTVRFFGVRGDDEPGTKLESILEQTPLLTDTLRRLPGATPATHVFSDPSFDGGERLFINQLGTAAEGSAGRLPEEFFNADVVQFGGTALVPPLHRRLPELLRDARERGCMSVVNTVYDFQADRDHAERRWTLGSDAAYQFIDLLVCDLEEARRLTEHDDAHGALEWFLSRGVGAAVVTAGSDPVWYGARTAERSAIASLPVYSGERVASRDAGGGDTTGCGDNFCGGVVAALCEALATGESVADLGVAVAKGVVSGAFCLNYRGGTLVEEKPGTKLMAIERMERAYSSGSPFEKRVDMELRRR